MAFVQLPNKKTSNVRVCIPGSFSVLSKGFLYRLTPFSLFAFLQKVLGNRRDEIQEALLAMSLVPESHPPN